MASLSSPPFQLLSGKVLDFHIEDLSTLKSVADVRNQIAEHLKLPSCQVELVTPSFQKIRNDDCLSVILRADAITVCVLPDPHEITLTQVCGVESVSDLVPRERLLLASSDLKELPESFGELRNLKTATLLRNMLTTLPNSFGQLTNLPL
jgi:Leucine-rich repeat (LRR) protein